MGGEPAVLGNTEARLSLADLLMVDDLRQQPRDAFACLLWEVEARGDLEGVVLVSTKMLEAYPEDAAALHALARAKLQLGAPDEAVAPLQAALLQLPYSILLRETLASAYEACGYESAAVSVAREIAELYRRFQSMQRSDAPACCADPSTAPSIILADAVDPSTVPSIVLADAIEPPTAPSIAFAGAGEPTTVPSIVLDDAVDPGTSPSIVLAEALENPNRSTPVVRRSTDTPSSGRIVV